MNEDGEKREEAPLKNLDWDNKVEKSPGKGVLWGVLGPKNGKEEKVALNRPQVPPKLEDKTKNQP